MTQWAVEVCRTGWGNQIITVEADEKDEAEWKALEKAPSECFTEHESEYEIVDSWKESRGRKE